MITRGALRDHDCRDEHLNKHCFRDKHVEHAEHVLGRDLQGSLNKHNNQLPLGHMAAARKCSFCITVPRAQQEMNSQHKHLPYFTTSTFQKINNNSPDKLLVSTCLPLFPPRCSEFFKNALYIHEKLKLSASGDPLLLTLGFGSNLCIGFGCIFCN